MADTSSGVAILAVPRWRLAPVLLLSSLFSAPAPGFLSQALSSSAPSCLLFLQRRGVVWLHPQKRLGSGSSLSRCSNPLGLAGGAVWFFSSSSSSSSFSSSSGSRLGRPPRSSAGSREVSSSSSGESLGVVEEPRGSSDDDDKERTAEQRGGERQDGGEERTGRQERRKSRRTYRVTATMFREFLFTRCVSPYGYLLYESTLDTMWPDVMLYFLLGGG